jgi:hypothetical protein
MVVALRYGYELIRKLSFFSPSLPPSLPLTDGGKRLPLRQGQAGLGTHAQHPLGDDEAGTDKELDSG